MSGIPWIHPTNSAVYSLWDNLQLQGNYFPGIWRVSLKKKRSLDIVKIRKLDGTMTLDNGYFGSELKADGMLWTQHQFDDLQSLLPNFDPQRRGGGRSPLAIYHPAAALFNVNQVYISEFEVRPPEGGRMFVSIDMVEWCADLKLFVQGFAGASQANKPLFLGSDKPSANTGSKI